MEIKIGKKTYNLTKVSITISKAYGEYVELVNEAASFKLKMASLENDNAIDHKEAELMVLDAKAALEDPESRGGRIKASRAIIEGEIAKKRSDKKYYEALESHKIEMSETRKKAGDKRDEVLRMIVDLNGYEWNADRWLNAISDIEFSELTEELFSGKKKEVEKSST